MNNLQKEHDKIMVGDYKEKAEIESDNKEILTSLKKLGITLDILIGTIHEGVDWAWHDKIDYTKDEGWEYMDMRVLHSRVACQEDLICSLISYDDIEILSPLFNDILRRAMIKEFSGHVSIIEDHWLIL